MAGLLEKLLPRRERGSGSTATTALGVVVSVGCVLATGLVLDGPGPSRHATRVELLVYSGRPNPGFELTPVEEEELLRRVHRLRPGAAAADAPGLGYSGLVVTFTGRRGAPDQVTVYRGVQVQTADAVSNRLDTEGVERWLLELARQRGYSDLLTALGL